ncbi:MAG: hypothetical protein ACI4XP_06995 [Acutalibacteraceae bacterium]
MIESKPTSDLINQIEAKLDEADKQAENTSKRLTHDEVFSNIISKLNN